MLQPEGGVKGKVAFADGSAPAAFTISVGMTQQSFTGDSASSSSTRSRRRSTSCSVRGPSFQARAVEVTRRAGQDRRRRHDHRREGPHARRRRRRRRPAGPGRDGVRRPPGVRQRHDRTRRTSGRWARARSTTTTERRRHVLARRASTTAISRSSPSSRRSAARKALRVPTDMPGQGELVLELQKFGALSGVLRAGRQAGRGRVRELPVDDDAGRDLRVASGPDGAYRYDKLAPDTYKVSATRRHADDGHEVLLEAGRRAVGQGGHDRSRGRARQRHARRHAGRRRAGKLGVASVWVATGVIAARTATDLSLTHGRGGPRRVAVGDHPRRASPRSSPRSRRAATPRASCRSRPRSRAWRAMGYVERHGDKLPAFCQPIRVASRPRQPDREGPRRGSAVRSRRHRHR